MILLKSTPKPVNLPCEIHLSIYNLILCKKALDVGKMTEFISLGFLNLFFPLAFLRYNRHITLVSRIYL